MALAVSCGRAPPAGGTGITISGSALGKEGELLARQIARFETANPDVRVRILPTPDDATQRHQLYVQWLNARVADPDVLQLDVIWTAEFAAAGWIASLDRYHPDTAAFFPAAMRAARWRDSVVALPWFVDVGMLYRRTDLVPDPPKSMDVLRSAAAGAMSGAGAPRYGIVWQGARYEGLVTVFLEYLGGFGGRVLDESGRVIVDSPAGQRALAFMRDEIGVIAPPDVLTWHEEESRFAFENGDAVFMRNWPYAYALLADSAESRVSGRYAVSPMPAGPGGAPTAALGGAELAVNAGSDAPQAAFRLVAFLAAPDQMLERAQVAGQFPARRALFDDPRLGGALAIPVAEVRAVIEHASERPVSPIYSELSEILQIALHRALARQESPEAALHSAAHDMNQLIDQSGLRATAGAARSP